MEQIYSALAAINSILDTSAPAATQKQPLTKAKLPNAKKEAVPATTGKTQTSAVGTKAETPPIKDTNQTK